MQKYKPGCEFQDFEAIDFPLCIYLQFWRLNVNRKFYRNLDFSWYDAFSGEKTQKIDVKEFIDIFQIRLSSIDYLLINMTLKTLMLSRVPALYDLRYHLVASQPLTTEAFCFIIVER